MRYRVYDARGYEYPVERRYDRLWRRAVSGATGFTPPTLQVRVTPQALRTLGLLGVRDLLAPPGGPRRALPVLYDGRDARVYANPDALPRAWVVAGQRRAAEEDAAPAGTPPSTAATRRSSASTTSCAGSRSGRGFTGSCCRTGRCRGGWAGSSACS